MSPIVSLGQHPGVGPGGTPRKMFLLNFTKALKKLHLLPIFPPQNPVSCSNDMSPEKKYSNEDAAGI